MEGVTLLAVGSIHYGYWAYNMALSLKYHSDIKIQLVCDSIALSGLKYKGLFDYITLMKQDHYIRKTLEPGLAKINLYEYLIFDDTIYFDADAVCVKDVKPLFKINAEYATQVFDEVRKGDGLHKNMRWQTTGKIWERYSLDEDAVLPATNTSFQLIRKGATAEKIYKDAKDAIGNSWKWQELALRWGRSTAQPDELYFNISLAKNGFKKVGEPVLFTTPQTKLMNLKTIEDNYYVIGYYGDEGLNAKFVRQLYDKLISKYSREYIKHHQQYKFHQLIKNKFLTKNVRVQKKQAKTTASK